ncbi:MAG: XdhC family protein [Drouetiella hepatica Uher 2000/2452]|jgi:xanthine/CO dehydrogenase XdhC/CoxF family maturation factor|uniref:XdhC family protein n=1 Tax=Drouetiella hepatica Uher 2000/2452 TaxID=904376 RepID=A0A951QGV3_9CYAN|nr:XdhC family protein [Drouetiella hepatica Uher 2000/2452]
MKELQAILKAFEQSQSSGQRSAIATVVKTMGSVYRRPGARMLLTEAGQRVGAISGGCLESDVFERAKLLLLQDSEPILVQYDTTASNDLIWGMGMGCKGVVEVLIESPNTESAKGQLEFIAECCQQNQLGVIATVFQVKGDVNVQVADRLFLKSDGTVANRIANPQLVTRLLEDTYRVLAKGKTQVISYTLDHGSVEVLIEVIHPPVPLLIFGAGYDAIPVVQLAKQLGWHVTVIDHRSTYATRDRFLQADKIIVCHPDELEANLTLNSRTIAVVMTHHYLHDRTLLRTLLPSPIRYLGVLGPKQRTQQLLEDLHIEGFAPTHVQQQRLHYPVGLDIGAETAEEIALAIVAEIQAVLTKHIGGMLRDRKAPIHHPNPELICPPLA